MFQRVITFELLLLYIFPLNMDSNTKIPYVKLVKYLNLKLIPRNNECNINIETLPRNFGEVYLI